MFETTDGQELDVSVVDLLLAIYGTNDGEPAAASVVADIAIRLMQQEGDCADWLDTSRSVKGLMEAWELDTLATYANRQYPHLIYLPDGSASAEVDDVVDEVAALELAMDQHVGPGTIRHRITLAHVVTNDYRHTYEALRDGVIPLSCVRRIVSETKHLGRAARLEVDKKIAMEARIRQYPPRKVNQAAERIAATYDPAAYASRARKARATRRSLWMQSNSDGTAQLSVIGLAEDVLATVTGLEKLAAQERAEGDRRNTTTLMSDLLFDRVLGRRPRSADGKADREALPVEVQVVVSAASLLGASEAPAQLPGYGAIPVELARQLTVHHAKWFRRLVCDPDDGHLRSSSRRRAFPRELGRFLQMQAGQECAIEVCGRRARHSDHIIDWAKGGATTLSNGQGLCDVHNQLKCDPRVTVTKHGDDIAWRFPTGNVYVQRPPPILGPGSGPPPISWWLDDISEEPAVDSTRSRSCGPPPF